MNRSLSFSLMFVFVCGSLFGQPGEDPATVLRPVIEAQFEQLDNDGDGKLSEEELDGFPKETLARMREHGLRKGYPLSREEFVTAGVAQMIVKEKDDERSLRKELKNDDSSSSVPPESAMGSPTGTRRNSSGKSRFAPKLPPEYQARDKNGDGQIGLYEWDRAKYAEFAKLDKNGDGFLTAAELTSKAITVAVGTKPAANSEPIEQDPVGKEARDTFARMDANRDGGIAEDEWAKSQRVRPMYENASITASLPMDLDSFVANFRKAKANETPQNGDGLR